MSERRELVAIMLRVAGPAVAIAFFIGWFLHHTGQIGTRGAIGVVLLGLLAGSLLGALVWSGTGLASKHLVRTMTASGGIPTAPGHSYEESLVARGKLEEARAAYEAQLERQPNDLQARLALAALWRDQLANPGEAERLYLEARRLGPSVAQEFAIANALIDLYHAGGQRGREMAELARFAARFAGSEAGSRARAALERMKKE
jgi:tetratricopeptide (TPR) repeat protein